MEWGIYLLHENLCDGVRFGQPAGLTESHFITAILMEEAVS